MNDTHIAFVSGAGRGIGFEFTQQLARRGYTVVGGYRDPGRAANLLRLTENNEHILAYKIDVTVEEDSIALRNFIKERFGRLDLLVNNAGVNINRSAEISNVSVDDLVTSFRINVVGPHLVVRSLLPLLKRGNHPRIVNITSQMGSIGRSAGGSTPYRVSKAALNMLTRNQAIKFVSSGITTIMMHPGWVKTDMGGPGATYSPEESVSGMLDVIERLTPEQNGAFLTHEGKEFSF